MVFLLFQLIKQKSLQPCFTPIIFSYSTPSPWANPASDHWDYDQSLTAWTTVNCGCQSAILRGDLKVQILTVLHTFIYFMCACVRAMMHVWRQRTTFRRIQFPHSTLWVLGVRLRLSDSAVSALTCCTTLWTLFLFSSLSLFSGQQSLRESFEIQFAKSLLSNLSLAFSSCSQHGSDNVRLKAHIQAHLMKISEKGE